MEENYIWTDDVNFRNALQSMSCTTTLQQHKHNNNNIKSNVENMNELLKLYYNTLIENIKNVIPKTIMYFLVKQIENDVSEKFYERILKEPTEELLQEEKHFHTKRTDLQNEQKKLILAKKSINEIM